MGVKSIDTFSNVAAMSLTESAANTQTSAKFTFPFSIMDKMALVLARVEYDFAALVSVFAANGDRVVIALTCAAAVTDIEDVTNPLIIDSTKLSRIDLGAAASGLLYNQPYIKDFSNLPGGGIIVAPNPLYLMCQGISAGAASVVKIRLYYTYLELKPDEYWQLVESRRIIAA